MVFLPVEVVIMIAELLDSSAQASLSRCSKALHAVCQKLLYRHDAISHNPLAAVWAVTASEDIGVSLRVLAATHCAGADFQHVRQMTVLDVSPRRSAHFISSPARTEVALRVTLLHLAAARGLADVVLFLLNLGIDVDTARPTCAWTPLFLALYFGQGPTAQVLLDRGGSIVSDSLGLTALHVAAAAGQGPVVTNLVQKCLLGVNVRDKNGDTPLMYALFSPETPYGTTFSYAAGGSTHPSRRRPVGVTCLATPRRRNCTADRGASTSKFTTQLSRKPTDGQRRDVITTLLRYGADPNQEVLMRAGGTSSGPILMKLFLSNRTWEMKVLLEQGAVNIDQRDSRLSTTLGRALCPFQGDPGTAAFLLKHGAKPEAYYVDRILGGIARPMEFAPHRPRLLKMFDVLHCHYAAMPVAEQTSLAKSVLALRKETKAN